MTKKEDQNRGRDGDNDDQDEEKPKKKIAQKKNSPNKPLVKEQKKKEEK